MTAEQLWAVLAEALREDQTGQVARIASALSEIERGEDGEERLEQFTRKFDVFVRSIRADPEIMDAVRRYGPRQVANTIELDPAPDSSTD